MTAYRIYWLDNDNRIVRADNLTAATDAEACDAAEARLGSEPAIEVWRGAQHIARIMNPKVR